MDVKISRVKGNPVKHYQDLSVSYLESPLDDSAVLDAVFFLAFLQEKCIGLIAARENAHISHLCLDSRSDTRTIAGLLLDRMVCDLKLKGNDLVSLIPSASHRAFFLDYGFREREDHVTLSYRPKEIFDVLDHEGKKTGRYIERGRRLDYGYYHLVVHVWKFNKEGRCLIDRRSFERGSAIDGKWETTGGAAVAGDDSLQAALRETKEELGIDLDAHLGFLFQRSFRNLENGHGWIQDVWVFEWNGSPEEIRFQASETCDARWVDLDTISQMMASGEFLGEEYYPYFADLKREMMKRRIG